ncbi:MAG: type IV secretion system DNA-binding domain-containing protein [Patescibacteria group bacterium]
MTDATTSDSDILYIGKSNFRGSSRVFGIKNKDRFQHMYVIGQTGTGKTSLLRNLAIQDIEAGRGVAVVDPHGEFVQSLLAAIPEQRLDDVIYFNPIDTDYPVGFNILEVKNPDHKHLVSSGLMSIFTKIWANVWSARMEYILNNTVLALLDTPGTTLLGIPRMLVDKIYRQSIIDKCKDPVVRSYWINEYEQYQERFRTEAIAPIQNKVGQFLSTYLVRNVVGQPKSTLNIEQIMNEGKILLVNVSKGLIGEDNSALLGAMLITKIQLAAMERVRIEKESERRDFLLYVDEFQNFATDSFASVLSEARKYRLGLIISHQYIGQLVTMGAGGISTKVRDAIFGNVGTMITFRVGATDAEFLEVQFAPDLVAQDFVNIPNYNVYMRLMVDGFSTRAFSATTLPPIELKTTPEQIKYIINNSRKNYSRPRAQVEQEISEWSGMSGPRVQPMPSPIANMPAPMSFQSGTRREEYAEGEEEIVKVAPPPVAYIKPKYETNLHDIGIDIGEMQMPKEVMREVPPEVSLGALERSGPDGPSGARRKRKRKRKHGPGFDQGGLREALGSAMNPQAPATAESSGVAKEEEYDEEPDRHS